MAARFNTWPDGPTYPIRRGGGEGRGLQHSECGAALGHRQAVDIIITITRGGTTRNTVSTLLPRLPCVFCPLSKFGRMLHTCIRVVFLVSRWLSYWHFVSLRSLLLSGIHIDLSQANFSSLRHLTVDFGVFQEDLLPALLMAAPNLWLLNLSLDLSIAASAMLPCILSNPIRGCWLPYHHRQRR